MFVLQLVFHVAFLYSTSGVSIAAESSVVQIMTFHDIFIEIGLTYSQQYILADMLQIIMFRSLISMGMNLDVLV